MKVLDYVHPLQGTESVHHFSNGNTLPLIARPFGMAAWSPQTDEAGGGWYFHPSHKHFEGIRLTHQPSPWVGDYGHLALMPQSGPLLLKAKQRSSSFRPEELELAPNYMKVRLRRYRSTVELAPSVRGAKLRLTFDDPDGARLIIAPFKGDAQVSIDPANRRVTGYTRANSGGVADNYAMYYVLEFDCGIEAEQSGTFLDDFKASGELQRGGDRAGAYVGLKLPGTGIVHVSAATSFISVEQAIRNMETELGGSSFEQVKEDAASAWEDLLGRITVEDPDEEKLHTFYTCMYRMFLFPRIWHEYGGKGEQIHYSPFTGQVHPGPMYSDNGFWDTARTVYALYALLCPSILAEMLEGFVNVYRESGWMPRWLSPGERGVMPGTLIDSVFVDALRKGIVNFDANTALEGLLKHAAQGLSPEDNRGRQGIAEYRKYGYVPCDMYKQSVNMTLDYAYGDFCIAEMARELGRGETAELLESAGRYKNVFDPRVGFMRGRQADGSWKEPFDPLEWGGPYCEGGPWQNSWFVPHDTAGLAELLGGREALYNKLQKLVRTPPDFRVGSYEREIHEMSEMAAADFGQCALSNQPSFHIPYLYAAIGRPAETQYWVRRACEELFTSKPDGYPGDEDNGSMAGWYIFSAMGLYPLCPGVPQYVIGSPLFQQVKLRFEDGKELVIAAPGNTVETKYVEQVKLNGQTVDKLYLTHEQLAAGGAVEFGMSDRPPGLVEDEQALPFSLSAGQR